MLLVAGPDLACAAAEIDALRRLYPHATALTGREATVAAVCAAMATSTLVHVAAHGQFRRDNPLFSSLQLHDGLLSVHHLETLPRLPSTVVLTACSSGRSGVLPGDELLGTSASLMSLGVRSLAAPLLPVADAATVAVAVGIHEGLRRHGRLAAALADCVRDAHDAGRADLLTAASSFNCFAASA